MAVVIVHLHTIVGLPANEQELNMPKKTYDFVIPSNAQGGFAGLLEKRVRGYSFPEGTAYRIGALVAFAATIVIVVFAVDTFRFGESPLPWMGGAFFSALMGTTLAIMANSPEDN